MGEPRTAFKPDDRHGLILYDYAGSPCARRVRITLIEKGLGWDTQVIDLSRLEQRNPEYLKLNPNGFVPTLAHGERVIYESNVITEHLDDVFPQQRLYPDDPWELAQVKMWQSAELAMAKDYRSLMYQRLMGPIVRLTRTLDEALAARRSTTDAADLAWEGRVWGLNVLTDEEERQYEDRLWKWLDVIERQLDGRDYLVGNRLTQAEVSLLPRVMMYAFVQQPITAERHPNVRRWMDHLSRRPSFATTLSSQDAGLLRLSRTPVMPWLQRTLRKPEVERTWSERLRLAVAKRFFGRVTAGRGVTEDAHAGQPRAILQPRNGTVPPAVLSTRALRPPSPETLAQPITLYDYPHSPHGRRIRILLLEKGLRWQTVDIDMGRMAHKAPDYLAVNPNGELPAIRHGDRVLYDSQLIAEYLDHIYRANPLYPDDAYLTAQVRMWLALEAGTHKEFRPLFTRTFSAGAGVWRSARRWLPRRGTDASARSCHSRRRGRLRRAPSCHATRWRHVGPLAPPRTAGHRTDARSRLVRPLLVTVERRASRTPPQGGVRWRGRFRCDPAPSASLAVWRCCSWSRWRLRRPRPSGSDRMAPSSSPPSAVTVNAGDTVDWQWMTGYHSTTGQQSPETWDSGVQYAPHTFSHTFMKPGTYSYFCSVHAALGMTGTVSVRAAVTTTTRPPSTSTTRPTTTIAPVSTSCTSIKACETALTTALPVPGTAKTGKERRIAGLLQNLARRADHPVDRARAARGPRQAHLFKKANRTLERLRAAAGKAESQGTLAVPLGPIDADVGSLESLDQSP